MEEITVDARYKFCPGPLLMLIEAIKELSLKGSKGVKIRLLATDPAAVEDVKSWAEATGHKFLGYKKKGEEYEIYLEIT